jgi:endogenous inhibitor of DNA gyrase (YacG/DUF329 family)
MTASHRRHHECAACAQPFPRDNQRYTGRTRQFCSDRCRRAAFRDRQAKILIAAHRRAGASQNEENNGVGSRPSEAENRDRAPCVDLLGGGRRMSWRGYRLDAKTVKNIIDAEIGPSRKLGR